MARGPLPTGNARRRNEPTIPTTSLPVGGRKGRAPSLPKGYTLGAAGTAWWRWAWRLPQASAWDAGALYTLARRAQLEDDLALLGRVDDFSVRELLDLGDNQEDVARSIEFIIGQLKRMAGGETTLMREMRELDNRLGLNPKALADLRWSIVADKPAEVEKLPSNVRRLPAIDPAAAAG